MNQKLNSMTVEELAQNANISLVTAEWWFSELGGGMRTNQTMTLGEFLTNRCDDCREIIQVYDSANFRINLHPVRCHACAKIARDVHGADNYESYYVV